jgi:signal transduction histidine kinase
LERFVVRYLFGEAIDTNKVVRSYSQAISRTLDVQQLSIVIIGTLNELLGTTRGALMLVTREPEHSAVTPIPGMGDILRRTIHLPLDSIFVQALIQKHQPLLQYELDYNPDYLSLLAAEKEWLQELAMEAYIPIITDQDLVGLMAIGPKRSALPYQPGELELLQVLADQTVVALQNARLYSELGTQNEQIQLLNTELINQNERLEIMDRVKSDFITIASHELRTPLTQVKGYSDILAAMNEENALTREQTREIVGHINRATLQLERLITAMLDASQLDVDGMQLTFVQTKLDMIIKLALEPLAQAMKERRISIGMVDLEELPVIYADFKRLVQAFQNLIGNAVKYTPDHGHIAIEANLLTSQNGEGDHIELVIADTGIGIEPQFHELIFEKFFRIGDPQLHSTGSTKFKGAGPGLGLPIAKGVIEAHDGRIWVESEGEDEKRLPGSRFYIILPVRPSGVQARSSQLASRPAYLVG